MATKFWRVYPSDRLSTINFIRQNPVESIAKSDVANDFFDTPAAGGTTYTITCAAGSYAITGVAATLLHHRKVTAAAGSYLITGVPATIQRSRILVAAPGSYLITGVAATLTKITPATTYTLTCDAGSYSIVGVAANIRRSRILTCAVGSYAITGVAANILHHRKVVAAPGSYSIVGQAATILRHRRVAAAAGAYNITGYDSTITINPAAGAVFPPIAQVLNGVVYGPTGSEYTGIYVDGIRYEIVSGKLMRPIGNKLALAL